MFAETLGLEFRGDMSTKTFVTIFSSALVLFWSAIGCTQQTAVHKDADAEKAPDIVAMVGDEAITKGELESALERLPQNRRKAGRNRILDYLIELQVFSAEARKAGLDKDLKTRELLERATNETLARQFVQRYVDVRAEPSEEEIKTHYLDNKERFVVPESVSIQHILVKKRQQAEALFEELKEGAPFEELVAKKSIARSWKKGGRLGWLYKGRMDPELEKAAFSLEKEKLSDVIQTQEGYQIIKVLDKREARKVGFDEAKVSIRNQWFSQRKNELIHEYYQEAKINRKPAAEGVLVTVGDEALTEEFLAPILARVSEKEKEKIKERWIRYFIETRVFSKESKKVGLESDPEVAAEVRRKTNEVLTKTFQKRFISDRFPVTDKDVAAYHASHAEVFRMPLRVRVKSIVVRTEEEAREILKALNEGAEFGSLAMERSVHPSAGRAGEIGWFGKGEKDPAIETVAYSLEKGQIGKIIKTKAGYEIIKLVDKKGGQVRPLEEIEQLVRMRLTKERFDQEKQRYYKKAGVKILATQQARLSLTRPASFLGDAF